MKITSEVQNPSTLSMLHNQSITGEKIKFSVTLPRKYMFQKKNLPRKTRSILSQLRSGYSTILNSYMSRIDENVQNNCPDCQLSPHNTNHMFSCPDKPTTLTTRSLWETQREVAEFLGLPTEEEASWSSATTITTYDVPFTPPPWYNSGRRNEEPRTRPKCLPPGGGMRGPVQYILPLFPDIRILSRRARFTAGRRNEVPDCLRSPTSLSVSYLKQNNIFV